MGHLGNGMLAVSQSTGWKDPGRVFVFELIEQTD